MPSDHVLTSPTSESAPEAGRLPDGLTAVAEELATDDALAQALGGAMAADDEDGFVLDRRGVGVAATGVAWRIVVPAGPDQVARAAAAASDALGRVARGTGPAPVVVGALPFEGTSPAILTIPRVAVVRRADGAAWRITVEHAAGSGNGHAGAGEPSVDLREGAVAAEDRGDARAASVPSPDGYRRMVAEARDRIRAGDAEKIVLARTLVVRGDAPFDRGALLRRLLREEPDAYTFAVRRFVGASPELLVSRFGDVVAANPLGGTARRSADPAEDAAAGRALLASEKDLREHALAADAVVADLSPVCSALDVNGPTTRGTATLWHLSTELSGRLTKPAPTALELAALLHPMPAVCGTPTATALELIDRLETFDRKLYGGLVGWMDAGGDGEWALALRCAELDGESATLYAGAGIVADSEPEAELAETDAKFGSMLRALEA